MEHSAEKKRPAGVLAIGVFTLVFRGILAFIIFLIGYFRLSPENWQTALSIVKDNPVAGLLTYEHFKAALIIQAGVSLIFAVCGAGILLGKELARKGVVYFSFFIVVGIFLSVLIKPGLITQVFPELIYPGIIIIYFTNKQVKGYFKCAESSDILVKKNP